MQFIKTFEQHNINIEIDHDEVLEYVCEKGGYCGVTPKTIEDFEDSKFYSIDMDQDRYSKDFLDYLDGIATGVID